MKIYLNQSTIVSVTRSIRGDLSGNNWTTVSKLRDADLATDHGTINVFCVVTGNQRSEINGLSVQTDSKGRYFVNTIINLDIDDYYSKLDREFMS